MLLSLLCTTTIGLSLVTAAPSKSQPKAKKLLGHDASSQRQLTDNDVIPRVRIFDSNERLYNSSHAVAEPLIKDDEVEDDNDDDESDLAKRFINGVDNRYQFSNSSYPFTTIGKIQWSNGVFCSGALVGPRHVLTAKHCIVEGQSGTFSPGYDNSARLGSGQVVEVITSDQEWGTPCGWKGDWAVFVLDKRMGDRLGYFGAKLPEKSKQDKKMFRHVGYPGDKGGQRPYRVDGNPVQSFRKWDCDNTGPFYTDTDCAGGQSGGPHWEKIGRSRYIWGTLSVTFDGGNGEAWAGWGSGNEMLNAIIKARREFP